ncbi:DNA-directed RNA polymerase I subunit RPA43 [Sigmodon hispidus]
MTVGCGESQRPKAASKRPVVGHAGVLHCLELPSYELRLPRYLSRKCTGIPEQLDAELLHYSESFLGVTIAYDNIRVVDSDAAGLFGIRGKLDATSLQIKSSVVSEDVAEIGIEEVAEKISKKKKDTETYAAVDGITELANCADVTAKEEIDLLYGDSMNDLCEEEPKKKKKKKREQKDQDPVFQASDSSGYQSDHKKKRKRSEEIESVTPETRQ